MLTQADIAKAPEEQKNILKVAFAEGYLAANNSDGSQKGGKTMKWLKVRREEERSENLSLTLKTVISISDDPTIDCNRSFRGYRLHDNFIGQRICLQVSYREEPA